MITPTIAPLTYRLYIYFSDEVIKKKCERELHVEEKIAVISI
jgi:hypothetical protein